MKHFHFRRLAALMLASFAVIFGCSMLSGHPAIEEIVYDAEYTEDGWDEPMRLSYRLPQLQEDTPDAREFNGRLQKLLEDAKNGNFSYDTANWEGHWNGSLLSLVICLRTPYQSGADYYTCNYDFSEGRALSNLELLARLKITEADAGDALLKAAAGRFDRDSLAIVEQYGDCFDALLELRALTISQDNLAIDAIPLFLGEDGVLHAVTLIGTPAGGGTYADDLTLKPASREGISKTDTLGNVTAELKNNQVLLTFDKTMQENGSFLSGVNVNCGTPYFVQGLCGEYADLALGYIGNDGSLYLCLTDANGQVSFCNLTSAALFGGPFCITGPLPQPQQVCGYETAADEDGYDFMACTAGGEKLSLYGPVNQAKETVPAVVQDSEWFTADKAYALSIRAAASGAAEAVWSGGGGALGNGCIFYNGMTQDGLRFLTSLEQENGGRTELLLTFSFHTDREHPGNAVVLTVTQRSGDPLSGVLKDGSVELFCNWEGG